MSWQRTGFVSLEQIAAHPNHVVEVAVPWTVLRKFARMEPKAVSWRDGVIVLETDHELARMADALASLQVEDRRALGGPGNMAAARGHGGGLFILVRQEVEERTRYVKLQDGDLWSVTPEYVEGFTKP